MIMVVGELQNRTYTSKDGVEVRVTEIITDRVCFTGEKAVSGAAPTADPAAAPSTPPPAPQDRSTRLSHRQAPTLIHIHFKNTLGGF